MPSPRDVGQVGGAFSPLTVSRSGSPACKGLPGPVLGGGVNEAAHCSRLLPLMDPEKLQAGQPAAFADRVAHRQQAIERGEVQGLVGEGRVVRLQPGLHPAG